MFKIFITLFALILAVHCAPPGWPLGVDAKAEMTGSGISAQAADGIINIASDYASKKPVEGKLIGNEAARMDFHQFLSEVETFMKTQSQADQTAYAAFITDKKAHFDTVLAAKNGKQ